MDWSLTSVCPSTPPAGAPVCRTVVCADHGAQDSVCDGCARRRFLWLQGAGRGAGSVLCSSCNKWFAEAALSS